MVIDFSATWCGPCRFMEPVINEFAEKYTDVEFVKIDVDELSVLLSSFSRTCLINFLFLSALSFVSSPHTGHGDAYHY